MKSNTVSCNFILVQIFSQPLSRMLEAALLLLNNSISTAQITHNHQPSKKLITLAVHLNVMLNYGIVNINRRHINL